MGHKSKDQYTCTLNIAAITNKCSIYARFPNKSTGKINLKKKTTFANWMSWCCYSYEYSLFIFLPDLQLFLYFTGFIMAYLNREPILLILLLFIIIIIILIILCLGTHSKTVKHNLAKDCKWWNHIALKWVTIKLDLVHFRFCHLQGFIMFQTLDHMGIQTLPLHCPLGLLFTQKILKCSD